jgi:two-component system chemotaxis response regulator CheB
MKYEAIVIGVSAGGMNALSTVLPRLPDDFTLPIIIVQHMDPNSHDYLSDHLNQKCNIQVKEAEDKEKIMNGVAYIAPANYHLLLEEDRTLSLSVDDLVNYSRPSIDVMFETAADVYRRSLVGVVLTGANADGSKGLTKIKALGGLAVVQDPATAHVDYMPKAAIASTRVDHILPLEEIANLLMELSNSSRADEEMRP